MIHTCTSKVKTRVGDDEAVEKCDENNCNFSLLKDSAVERDIL